MTIRQKLDVLVAETSSCNEQAIPTPLLKNIKKWKWGSYGWVSPASLIFTAAWRKIYHPNEDCCKIWARDEQNKAIPGGYSIRSEDEEISIPLLAKYELCLDFCSDNSGMQGSRAIEKMRSHKRINVDFDTTQRTVFDLKLFATILNQINELTPEQATEVVRFLIVIAKEIRTRRIASLEALRAETQIEIDIMAFLTRTSDPELTKCIAAACFDTIFSPSQCIITGVEDYKTAADARAKKPGDICVMQADTPRISVEVKDKTQNIDWNNIERACKILDANPSINNFIFVLEQRNATVAPIITEIVTNLKMSRNPYNKISIISLHDLHLLASSIVDVKTLTSKISEYMALAPAIKINTKANWIKTMNEQ